MELSVGVLKEETNSLVTQQVLQQLGFCPKVIKRGEKEIVPVFVTTEGENGGIEFSNEIKNILYYQQNERSAKNSKSNLPFCDVLKLELLRKINNFGFPIPRIDFFPNGANSALIPSHDVEWNYTINELRSRFLPFEISQGMRSTLFMRPRHSDYSPPSRALVSEFANKGFEIATHGDFSSQKNYYSHSSLKNVLYEKATMDRTLGSKIWGVAPHCAFFTKNSWLYYERAGYMYDRSQISDPNRGGGRGFNYGTAWPWHPIVNGRRLNLLAINAHFQEGPWVDKKQKFDKMNIAGLESTVHGIRMSDARQELISLVYRAEKYHSALGVITHPEDFVNPDQVYALYKYLIKMAHVKGMWIATNQQLCRWWLQREQFTLNAKWDVSGVLQIRTNVPSNAKIVLTNHERLKKVLINGKKFQA